MAAVSECSCVLFLLLLLQVEKEFSFSLFDLDWEVFSVNIEGAVNRVPVIEKTGIKSTVCGPGMSVCFYDVCYRLGHICDQSAVG